jgi:hypothetical protein
VLPTASHDPPAEYGVLASTATRCTAGRVLRTKVEKELGLSPDALWPYSFFSLNFALVIGLACTLLALFCVGVAKRQVTRLSLCALAFR